MKRILLVMLIVMALVPFATVAAALDFSLPWGETQGLTSENCSKIGESPERTEDGWIHWIVTSGSEISEAQLVLSGSGEGTYDPNKYGPVVEFFTPYYNVTQLSATLNYNGTLGDNTQFVISDYCSGDDGDGQDQDYPIPEFPTVALPIAAILGLAFFMQRRKE